MKLFKILLLYCERNKFSNKNKSSAAGAIGCVVILKMFMYTVHIFTKTSSKFIVQVATKTDNINLTNKLETPRGSCEKVNNKKKLYIIPHQGVNVNRL